MSQLPFERQLGASPLGRVGGEDRTRFRVWAPAAGAVTVRLGDADLPLEPEGLGVWAGEHPAGPGDDYWLVVDGKALPDPCSRHQPQGLRGPSRIVDPGAWRWTDGGWRGVALDELVIYELHVGTFTAEGTFDAAIAELGRLHELGVTAIEVMPVAEFPGRRGWGYDGVYFWSAHSAYGGPDGFQRLVDAAHAAGIAVILDVVYNHVGASGEPALRAFGPYFTTRYDTFWGDALNYDDAEADGVREWVLQSAEAWVRDLHVDGLRLDAIHAIFDRSARPIVGEVCRRVRAIRPETIVIAESGLNDARVMRPADRGGLGTDASWADDFHHSLRTLLTGERDGYYSDYGRVADLAKAWRVPFVYDGTWSELRRRRYGAPAADVPPRSHVVFSANHDQIGNRAFGDRLPPEARALAAFCTLLSPYTPMLFMGDEYGEQAPFQFFSDHIDPEIAEATRAGRRREFAAFAEFAGKEVPDPQAPETFERSKLTRREDPALAELHHELLALRRRLDPGPADVAGFDERARTLRVRRGRHEIVMSFSSRRESVEVAGREVVLTTAKREGGPVVKDGVLELPPISGAVLS